MRIVMALAVTMAPAIHADAQIANILKQATSAITGSSSSSSTSSSSTSTAGDLISSLTTVFNANKTAKAADLTGGTWEYVEPAIVFSSDNALKKMGGKVASAAIEKQIQQKLDKYGIKKGTMKMTFDSDGNFTQTVAGKKLSGTYTISGQNVVLKYAGMVKQLAGTTQVDGNSLLIVMDASKLLSYMKTIGSLSGNSTLKTASSLIGSMNGMQCGFRLQK